MGDGNDECGGIDSVLSQYFFDDECVSTHCYGEEISEFMNFLTSELRFESVILTEIHLMALFMILQLGGIPNVRRADGVTINVVGLGVWTFWASCVAFQYLFTFLSLVMTVLATFAINSQYSRCMTEIQDGPGPGVGAGLGGAVGLAAGAMIRAYLVHFTYQCRVHTYIVATLFYVLPFVVGAGVGASWGAATTGSPFFGTIIPSLLCHPQFVAKQAALLAYVYTFSLGLVSAGFKFNPDIIIRLYVYATVGPCFVAGVLYWVSSGSFAFSISFFVPSVVSLAVVCVVVFIALRFLQYASGDGPMPTLRRRAKPPDDDGTELTLVTPRNTSTRSPPIFPSRTPSRPSSRPPSRDPSRASSRPRAVSRPRALAAARPTERQYEAPPPPVPKPVSTPKSRTEAKSHAHIRYVEPEPPPNQPRERPVPEHHDFAQALEPLTLRARTPRRRAKPTLVPMNDDATTSPPEMVELKRDILAVVARAKSQGMDQDAVTDVLLGLADVWVAEYRDDEEPGGGDLRETDAEKKEEESDHFNPFKAFSGSLWWLPHDLLAAVIRQWRYDTSWSFAVEGNSSMFRIVLSTVVLIVLAPFFVFGCWTAGYVYMNRGMDNNEQFIRVVYRHFFGVFQDFTIVLPPLSLFSLPNFDFALIFKFREALFSIADFNEVPPIVMIDGSGIFSALSLSAALAKVIASFVGAAFAALGIVERNKIIGDVAKVAKQ
jgi:hypothetical protein